MMWNNLLEHFLKFRAPWAIDESGKLNYDWIKGVVMPQELADIICKTEVGEEREMSDNNEDIDNEDGYYDELKLTMLILTM